MGLAKLLNRFGISALRMTMAYHAERMPAELQRADYHVSSNVGRTIHAARQSVIDARACLDWLAAAGLRAGRHSGDQPGVVRRVHRRGPRRAGPSWASSTTSRCTSRTWSGPGSPRRMCARASATCGQPGRIAALLGGDQPGGLSEAASGPGHAKPADLGAARQHFSAGILAAGAARTSAISKLPHEIFTLPCGHYTTGQFPFNLMDGLAMCRFAARNL